MSGKPKDKASQSTAPVDDLARLVVTIRPLHPETAIHAQTIRLRSGDFPFYFGRRVNHRHEVARHVDGQELKIVDKGPFQVSRNHCSLEISDGQVVVLDAGSTLGTIVNGQSIGRKAGCFIATLKAGVYELTLGTAHSPHRFEISVEFD